MRMRFDPSTGADEAAFYAARDALLDEFEGWRAGRGDPDSGMVVSDAALFLDWRYNYSTGVLDDYDGQDLDEFLLGWCPRKLTAPPDMAPQLCRDVGQLINFLAATGRLVGGSRRATALTAYANELAPRVRRAMDDPSNFGMAKSIFAGVDLDAMPSVDDPEAMQQFLDQKMAELNALPYEERKALTDPDISDDLGTAPAPYLHISPTTAELERAAVAAPITGKIEALRDYLGAEGKALTNTGNLKLVDGKALVDLLDTGDQVDPAIGDRTFKTTSSADLRRLRLIVELAKSAGAVRVYRRRLVPVKGWSRRDPTDRASGVVTAAAVEGPLWLSFGGARVESLLMEYVDDALPHWLTMLLPSDVLPFDEVADVLGNLISDEVEPRPPYWTAERIVQSVADNLARSIEVLELVGAIRWNDREQVTSEFGQIRQRGGALSLTALGRHVVSRIASEVGYPIQRVDLADAEPSELFAAIEQVNEADLPGLIASWQPNLAPKDRARRIAEAVARAAMPRERLAGMAVLDEIGTEASEPYVRQLLDGPLAGHAASWLLAHDLADVDEVGDYIDAGFVIDLLATCQDDPEELCALFLHESPAGGPDELLDQMWQHDAPETEVVLEVLGQHLTDRRLAKAARKALFKHRSRAAQH
ncbi:hypothetical protein FOE78_02240 [Microlunatus elymi]|uniref:Uncharacterized protein n=1 Tax=Microlunatus elymi TaxID=2596828 RepID=A0A516PUR1_9ACTN|nr:hypothetical protein [Microlunatus elymi]QDP94892.1 hypothetical protein FOE78_02240 [Microlunatus elymi]